MKVKICTSISVVLLLQLISIVAYPQSVAGKWYGIGNADVDNSSNSYLCEFILIQKEGKVSGYFNYFFRNGYISNKVTGYYDAGKRLLFIKPVPVVFHQSADVSNSIDCIMTGFFSLKTAKQESTLSGMFESDELHKYLSPPIKVKFRRLAANEPTLKERIQQKELVLEEDSVITKPAGLTGTVQPVPKQTAILPGIPSLTETEKNVKLRANVFANTLDVAEDSVDISLYDNGQMDYDSISVFYNKQLIVHRQLLDTKKPVVIKVAVSSDDSKNELVMFAENLGTIPPNSAIMIIQDKTHRYEVPLTSTYQKNAAIRLHKMNAIPIQ